MSRYIAFLLCIFLFSVQATAKYSGQNLKFQKYTPGTKVIQIEIENLTGKNIRVTYRHESSEKSNKIDPIVKTLPVASVRIVLDPLFAEKDDIEVWRTDKNCIGKTTWQVQLSGKSIISICNSPERLQALNKMLTKFFIMLR